MADWTFDNFVTLLASMQNNPIADIYRNANGDLVHADGRPATPEEAREYEALQNDPGQNPAAGMLNWIGQHLSGASTVGRPTEHDKQEDANTPSIAQRIGQGISWILSQPTPYDISSQAMTQPPAITPQSQSWNASQQAQAQATAQTVARPGAEYPGSPSTNPYDAASREDVGPSPQVGTGPPETGSAVIQPFDPKYFNNADRTEVFHQTPGEYGNDYAMPQGTNITSPFSGTIIVEDMKKANWGKRIFVRMANGIFMAIGHMHAFGNNPATGKPWQTGDIISAGESLGESGGDVNDLSSGKSTGPHVELQFGTFDPNGNPIYTDPLPILNQIYREGGVSYDQLTFPYYNQQTGKYENIPGQFSQAAGDATPVQQPLRGFTTPDGHYISPNSREAQAWTLLDGPWKSQYGVDPPWSIISSMANSGGLTAQGVSDYMNAQPSSIPGVNLGQYSQVKDQATRLSQAQFGRPVPDSFIAQLFKNGFTSQQQIKVAMESLTPNELTQNQYQQIWDTANDHTQAVWGETPSPGQIGYIAQRASGVGLTSQ